MAGVVASKVRKQRNDKNLGPLRDGDEEAKRRALLKIPIGPGGVRQLPGQANKVRRVRVENGLRPNPDGSFEGGGSANVILYVGLGMIAIGLVITFVGLGEKGFKTLELKLIGPSLVGCGVFFALLRILFCTVPSCCRSCIKVCRKTEETQKLLSKEAEEKMGAVLGGPHQVQRNGVVRPRSFQQPGQVRSVPISRDQHRADMGVRVQQGTSGGVVRPRVQSQQHPHSISDSEEEVEHVLGRQRPRGRPPNTSRSNGGGAVARGNNKDVEDNYSNTSSSTFSLAEVGIGPEIALRPPLLAGSTKNLQTGEIILNSTRLQVEAT